MTHDELLPTGENIPVLAIDGLDLRVRATPKNAPDPPLRLTDIPHTFLAQAPVLNPRQIREIHRSLAENDPSRIRLFQAVHAHNRAMLHQYPRIGVYLDGRSIVGNKKKYTITRDGSWGDAVEASIAIEATLQAGKDVTVLSSQPSVFGRAERHTPDRVSHIQIPDDVFPFQFYPFSLPGNPSLLNFLFQHQGQDMAYIAPLNARLPVIFRVEEGGGVLDERTLRAVNTLKEAVHGTRTDPFSGIHMREWENLCHQSQALQVMIDLLGIDTRRWEKFPRPYLNPPAAARQLAREYAGYFSPDAINTVFHIGVANNMKKKEGKAYPVENWEAFLTDLAENTQTRNVRIGPLLFFEPINPSQATQTQRIASHAKKLFGEEKVIVLPIRNDWDMSAFVAFIAELAKHGILVCNDSAPAHIGRAGGASVLEIGNRRFNPNFYTPEGSMVVLPAEGDDASGVRPHDVVEAFLNMAKTLLEN